MSTFFSLNYHLSHIPLSCLIIFPFSSLRMPPSTSTSKPSLTSHPFLFSFWFIAVVFPPVHPHRSLIAITPMICRRETIWKLAGCLGAEVASAFIPRTVAATKPHPHPAKAANEKMVSHFLVSKSVRFKEAQDIYTQTGKQTDRNAHKEKMNAPFIQSFTTKLPLLWTSERVLI